MRAAFVVALVAACMRPAEERAALDESVGRASAAGLSLESDDGLAHVRRIEAGALELFLQAPVVRFDVTADGGAARTWRVVARNVLADAALDAGGLAVTPVARGVWDVEVPAGGRWTWTIAPPDAGRLEPWRFIAMADIQDALPCVHEVFAEIDARPDARFVISMGDITRRSEAWEYDLWEDQLTTLDVPYYSTIGNHELFETAAQWTERFGRMNLHFRFRGVTFTIVDSGSATIDPIVYGWLDGWLDEARDDLHVFATHYPPIDPLGYRQGSFESRDEGSMLLAKLAAGGVDLTLYGHIHTYVPFENAGIPAFISGGGGADPMLLDGIDRHFLIVSVDPVAEVVTSVEVVRIPDEDGDPAECAPSPARAGTAAP